MRNWFQKCHLSIVMLIVLILAVGLIVGCGAAATTPPPPPPTPSNFSYLVQVQAKDTGQKVESAEVIISVGGRVPLNGFTDSKGIARVIIPSDYVNEPGVLAVEAEEFKEYTQNIDLVEGALPDDIRLDRVAIVAVSASTLTPIVPPLTPMASAPPTDIPTTVPTNTPTAILTDTPTPTPTEEEQPTEVTMLVEAQDTGQGISGAQVEIKVSGQASINVTTDSQGNVTISIFPSYMGQSGELNVEAIGFQSYREIVDLTEDALPKVIQLGRLLLPTATPGTATPRITGRLAIPLMLGLNPKVYLVDVDGTLIQAVDGQQPDFTRDGDQLIINGEGGIAMLYRTDRDGNFLALVGDPGLTEHAHPAWSPDGAQVIYDDNTITPPSWYMFKRGLDDNIGAGEGLMTAALRPILDPNPLYPLWTTQDRFIFRSCNTWVDGGQCGLWMMQGNLGEPERLTNNFNHVPTDIDGNTLIYVSQEAGDWNVYTLDIESKTTQQLTFNPAADSLATISPDGNWVAFLSNRDGGLAVWTVSIDGSSVNKMFDINPQWGTLRSDGWSEERLSWGK